MTAATTTPETYTPVDPEDAASIIGPDVHSALRKAATSSEAPDLWLAIHEAPEAWSEALALAMYGLAAAGYALCRKAQP